MKSDEDLLQDFARGSDLAFAAIYNRYRKPVYLFALKMLADGELAQDVLQTVFLTLYEQRTRALLVKRVRPWIFTIVRNRCLNEIRDRAPREQIQGESAIPDFADAMETIEKQDEARIVLEALKKLSPDYREALILREYQGLTYEEIAEATASSESAVKSRLFKARRQMFEILRPIFLKG